MPHPESEHGLRVQLATALRERDEARHGLDEWCKAAMQERARATAAESALAAARMEIAELRDDLGASHSRGAHLHCSKDSCDVAADGMALAAANARAESARRTSEKRLAELTKYYEAHGKELARAEAAESALAAARRECEGLRKALRTLTYAWRSRAMASEDGGDKEAATLLYGCAAEVDAALVAPAAAAGEEGT